ncbi:MAG: SGNH/GDSL hydrolase family protein [Acidimicrobiia bacterium]|nr:SGNH/GDSL hydrolase family protein [Acidimicrobiia bacterium]
MSSRLTVKRPAPVRRSVQVPVPALALGCVLVLGCVFALAGCAQGARDVGAGAAQSAGSGPAPKSIVQLGDSVAAGEGTLYGYAYDPVTREWTGGNLNAPWPPPYPGCHDSPDAYGNLVAEAFGATFHQFACTGATFASGIVATEVFKGQRLRPPQFGDWSTQQGLDTDYDAAAPDLVLVSLGANDVQFVGIVTECIKNGYEYYFGLTRTLQCTSSHPGPTVQSDFFNFLPTLKKNYATLVSWITARADANHVAVPKVLFTTYPDPFPPSDVKCPDTSWFYPAQVAYLTSLLQRMDDTEISTIKSLKMKGVSAVDLRKAYVPNGVDHRWCSSSPWAYGLSIYHFYDPKSFQSQAPFHPTPSGQQSMALHVVPAVTQLFNTVPPARLPLEPPPTAAGP